MKQIDIYTLHEHIEMSQFLYLKILEIPAVSLLWGDLVSLQQLRQGLRGGNVWGPWGQSMGTCWNHVDKYGFIYGFLWINLDEFGFLMIYETLNKKTI